MIRGIYVTFMFYCVEMKRTSIIAGLFKKHEAKKIASSSTPLVVDDVQIEDSGLFMACLDSAPPILSDTESESENKDETPHPPSPQQPYARSYDAQFLPYDPGERIPISRYHANVQDDVRRGYIMKGPLCNSSR
jgi:hypothetical protein